MEVKTISPPVTPFLQIKLDQEVVDYLWKIIDIAKTDNKSYKNNLAGNISQSLLLGDIDSFCKPCQVKLTTSISSYINTNVFPGHNF